MKNTLLLIALFLTGAIYAQEFHRCATHQALLQQEESNPGYMNQINETFERAKAMSGLNGDREEVYTIPVVVHIVYNTPEENLHDSIIFNQIESLNADFRRMNADTVNLRDTFQTIVGDSYIQFKLAEIDPDGNPTTGITRTETSVNSFFGVGTFPADGVKYTSEGGIDPWNQDNYLNIWVCDMSFFDTPAVLGYATPPDGLPNWPDGSVDGLEDGVVIQYQSFGSNNPNPLDVGGGPLDVLGRTATHEVGHYLGLRHIWADGGCTEEDGIDDTPNAVDQSEFDCDDTKNTCTDDIGELGDLPDMIENYMDYSAESCQNSFTKGQVDLMRGVLETERIDLIQGNPAIVSEKSVAQFKMYPNPANGMVTLNNLPEGTKQIELYSETGQLLRSINTASQKVTMDELNVGFYLVSVQSTEGVSTQKLVVTASN
ncbi:MAG: T9SS type A sorting domain-containing protein [Flavobacteriales bacterium]|nr:T9SS type A sorting domain-containing protein [Flavobacteriales bacterium]